MNDLIALRDAIRAYLKTHPYSQTRIAAEIGASQTWVGKFIRGEIGAPRLERLVRLQKWVEGDKATRINQKAA
jgi:predicted transcriptional regulator